jgi:phospholipid transport system substrate-binding protein
MRYTKNCLFFVHIVVLMSFTGLEAWAESPGQQIQQTLQQVITVVSASSGTSDRERRKALHDVLVPRFDFLEMAKRSLGKHWNNVPGRHDEFVAVFADFLGHAYVGKISSYKDEKILLVGESMDKELAEVDTKVVPAKGDPFSVNYRLHRVAGEWKVYDVVVEDISLVKNYHSQFNRIITRGSFDDLLKRLREKEL